MKNDLAKLTLLTWLLFSPTTINNNFPSNIELSKPELNKKELVKETRQNILFTIDDGPSKHTSEIAKTLDSLGYKWIFFMVTRWINQKTKKELIDILKMWHHIWNHSYSHVNFRNVDFEEAKYQILKSDSIISSIYKEAWIQQEKKYIRYPYWIQPSNWFNDKIVDLLDSLGYEEPMFRDMDVDLRDWKWIPELEKIKKLKDWDLILLHERSYTPQTIKQIVKSIDDKNSLDTIKYCVDLWSK